MNSPMFDPTTSVLDAYPTRASLRRAQSGAADPATPKPEEVPTVPIETIEPETVKHTSVAPTSGTPDAPGQSPLRRETAAYPAPGAPVPNKPLPVYVYEDADLDNDLDDNDSGDDSLGDNNRDDIPLGHDDLDDTPRFSDDEVSHALDEIAEQSDAGVAGFSFFFPQAARAVTRPIPRQVTLEVGLRDDTAPSRMFGLTTPIVDSTSTDATLDVGADSSRGDYSGGSANGAANAPGSSSDSSTAHNLPESADADLLLALAQVVLVGGSDLHITANAGPTLRVDGRLQPVVNSEVWSHGKVTAALHSILTPEQEARFATDLELDLAITLTSQARFRVNLYQQRGAIGGAFRLIPTEIKQLGDLGMPDVIGRFAALPRGLVLVTGPTGSGKSTTLAALLDLVNRTRADHIVTVEDPIEFLHSNKKSLVNQREVGSDTHSFAAALKHVLRQDPDVILIGELRDLETISVALTAAETGHLVFATLHTQDAAQSIDRVIDVFPPHQQAQVRAQLAATLQGVVCQTLVRRASGTGRVAATEVLVTTPAIANLVREGKTHQIHSAMQAGADLGMHTLDQHLAQLVDVGKITHAAAAEKARDAVGLRQLIKRDVPAGSGAPLAVGGVDFGDTYSSIEPIR